MAPVLLLPKYSQGHPVDNSYKISEVELLATRRKHHTTLSA